MVCNCSIGPYFVYNRSLQKAVKVWNRSLQKAVKVWLYGRIHYVTNSLLRRPYSVCFRVNV